jgi:hypothetical protein
LKNSNFRGIAGRGLAHAAGGTVTEKLVLFMTPDRSFLI